MLQDERVDAETKQKFLPKRSGQSIRERKICGLTVLSFSVIAFFAVLILVVGILALVRVFLVTDSGGEHEIFFVPKNKGSNLIWFNRSTEKLDSFWGFKLTEFFKRHYRSNNVYTNCAYGGQSATTEEACLLDVTTMNTACSKENSNFGYDQGTPCVLIRLNNKQSWTPEAYKTMEDLVLAKKLGMPQHLIHRIEMMMNDSPTDPMLDTIWVSCEGENPMDRENIGPIEYYWPAFRNQEFQGIPNYYYPYLRQRGYKVPFIFVKFAKPKYNVVIRVECKLWAKNIYQNGESGFGSVQFNLIVD